MDAGKGSSFGKSVNINIGFKMSINVTDKSYDFIPLLMPNFGMALYPTVIDNKLQVDNET